MLLGANCATKPISDRDFKLASIANQDFRISFPEYEMDSCIERVDFPEDFSPQGEQCVFWRHEMKFF